jgi:S-adenosylhomocysteine hydrolase
MNEQVPFDSLTCLFCSRESRPDKETPDLDYYISEVPVSQEDGTEVKVPIDIRELDIEYEQGGQYAVRVLARVPCPSCGTHHAIDVSSIRKAPALAIRDAECPRCHTKGEIVSGPRLHYREKDPDDIWVTASALMKCSNPNCHLEWRGTSNLSPEEFQFAENERTIAVTYNTQSLEEKTLPVTTLPLARSILDQPFGSFPMLHWAKNVLRSRLGQPFEGLECLFVLHYLTDLLPYAQACRELGLAADRAVFFYKSQYRYPHRDSIRQWLESQGFRARPVEEAAQHIMEMEQARKPGDPPIMIVEDGGYIVPLLHERDSALLAHTIGAIEQTTKGVRKTEDWGKKKTADRNLRGVLQFPLISIPDSTIKTRIEPPLIGNEVVHCIQQLTTFSLHGARVALLGLGTIGMEVFQHLKAANAIVTGYDELDSSRKAQFAMAGGTLVASAAEAVRGKRLVIGCSGRPSITSSVLENLDYGAYVASGSSDLVEIDIEYLEHRAISAARFGIKDADVVPGQLWGGTRYQFAGQPGREINLLADGYPVTFWGAPGMPHEGGDLIMTVILVAAAELAARNGPHSGSAGCRAYPNEICRDAVDSLGADYELSHQHLKLYRPDSQK